MEMFLRVAFSILWMAIGIVTVAWFARWGRNGLLSTLRVGLPAFTAITMLIVVVASPRGSLLPRILHHAGFTILGVFLLATEFLRLFLRRLPDQRDLDAESLMLCRSFRTVTVLFAPPAANFLPSTWRSVGAAVALWGVVGFLIGCAFKLGNRRKLPG
jgi:hypothetical protein